MAKQAFQLKPKHLVRATLAVCALAIVLLILGVIGTFNPRDEERKQEEKAQKAERQANRVEVWKPDGANSQGAVILNPDAVNQPRQAAKPQQESEDKEDDSDDEQAARNPFLPSSPARSRMDNDDGEPVRRARPRVERERDLNRVRPAETKPAQPAATLQSPTVTAPAEAAAPVHPRVEQPKPEPRPEPKAEVKAEPKPEPKVERRAEPKPELKIERREEPKAEAPRPAPAPAKKEVMDNLF